MEIVQARPADGERLTRLLAAALPYDRVVPSIVEEKLFFNPNAGRDEYTTFLAAEHGEAIGVMQSVVRRHERKGWLGLFGVARAYRGRGIARALLGRVRKLWHDAGLEEAEVLTIPGNYFSPGIDPRYTEAICFVQALGFRRTGEAINMRASLDDAFDTRDDERRLARKGVEVRRACENDAPRVRAFFDAQFGEGWLRESELAMGRTPPGLHLALKEQEIIAFAAHSSMNVAWGNFGPMGTTEAARGQGIGRVLLYRCMADLKAAGHETALIPWVGPYQFYSRWLRCRIERVFWRFALTPIPDTGQESGERAS
jgi:mycothiol synthase